VRNLIYPVPDPRFPFLGVHFTRLIHGGIEAGPECRAGAAREGYRKTDFNARDLFDAFSYGGFWRFLRRYPSMCWYELRRSFSRAIVLPLAAAAGARDPAGRPGNRRLRRARAGDHAGRRTGAGFPFDRAAQRAACAECAEPRGHGVAGDRRGDRGNGGPTKDELHAMMHAMKDEIIEAVRDMQTEMLRGIELFARGNFSRFHTVEAPQADVNTRLGLLEERLLAVELRVPPRLPL
jgi:hypothetical protein